MVGWLVSMAAWLVDHLAARACMPCHSSIQFKLPYKLMFCGPPVLNTSLLSKLCCTFFLPPCVRGCHFNSRISFALSKKEISKGAVQIRYNGKLLF